MNGIGFAAQLTHRELVQLFKMLNPSGRVGFDPQRKSLAWMQECLASWAADSPEMAARIDDRARDVRSRRANVRTFAGHPPPPPLDFEYIPPPPLLTVEGPPQAFSTKLPEARDCIVYALWIPGEPAPFYIGEGAESRPADHFRMQCANEPKKERIKAALDAGWQAQHMTFVLARGLTKTEAQREEHGLIARWGRVCDGGALTNVKAGVGA